MDRTRWLPLSRGQQVLAAAATLLVMLAGLAVAMNLATLQARVHYVQLTSPQFVDPDDQDEQVLLRWQPFWAAVDGRTLHVALVQPVAAAAPPPFGLDQWPRAGEFAYSADLAPFLSELQNRWGTAVAEIPSAYLPGAQSRIIVYRPAFALADEWGASGYGLPYFDGDPTKFWTGTITVRIPSYVSTGGIAFTLVPVASIVLYSALQRSAARHRRRLVTLETLGVRKALLHRHLLAAHAPGLAAGLVLAAAATAALMVWDARLPVIGFTNRALDMRAMLVPTLVIAGATAVLVVGVAVLALRPPALAQGRRPAPRPPTRWRWLLAGVCVAGTLVASQAAVASVRNALSTNANDVSAAWVLGGGLLALASAPALMSVCFLLLARGIERVAHRRGSGHSLLVAKALTNGQAGSIAAAAASLVLLMSVAATWSLAGQVPALQQQRERDEIDGAYATVNARSEATGAAIANLEGLDALVVDSTFIPGEDETIDTAVLTASRQALDHWGLRPDATLPASELPDQLWRTMVTPATIVTVTAGEPPPLTALSGLTTRSYVLFDPTGGRVDAAYAQRVISAQDSPLTQVRLGGDEWIVGANDLADEMRWLTFIGATCALMLIGTLWLRSVDDHRERADQLAPLEALFASRSVVRSVHLWVAVITAFAGAAVGGSLGALLARSASGDLSTTTGVAPIVLAMATAAFVASLASAVPLALGTRTDEWVAGRRELG